MVDFKLKIDSNNIEDLLDRVEQSFDIKFGNTELMHITTFGELCDHIATKVQLNHSDDCTTQQAFYKLRSAILVLFKIDGKTISTNTQLADLLPQKNRRKKIQKLEKILGIKLNVLQPKLWLVTTFFILLLASLVGFYIYWQIGLLGLIISICGLFLVNKIGSEFNVQTVGEVAEKITRENYLKSRRNSKTFNKNEIEKVLIDLFSSDLGLKKCELAREAKFI